MELTALILVGLSTYTSGFVTKKLFLEAPAHVEIKTDRLNSDGVLVKIRTFHEDFNLQLHPKASPLKQTFRLQRPNINESGEYVIEDIKFDDSESMVYEDPALGTSLNIKDGTIMGILTPTTTILPHINGDHVAIRQFFPFDPESGHVTKDYKFPEFFAEDLVTSDLRGSVSVTPEIYVIVDSVITSYFKDTHEIRRYLSVFWSAVNQRYASLKDPSIELIITGALIIQDTAEEPFITDNIISEGFVLGEDTLNSLGDLLYENKHQMPHHDLTYLMTGRNMALVKSGTIEDGIAGFAWQNAACLVLPPMRRTFSTAMGEDTGAVFTGVLTATHEIAHTLGAPHDGDLGAESCPWANGYIMSYVPGKTNKFSFSTCSKKLMKKFLASPSASCLRETAGIASITYSPVLPGELVTMDEQCQKIIGKDAAYVSTSVNGNTNCLGLVCKWQEKMGKKIYAYTVKTGQPAAEGSQCGDGGRCISGVCEKFS